MSDNDDRVRDFFSADVLKEVIVQEFIAQQSPIDPGDVEPDENEIRQNVEDFFEAVADGTVVLPQDRLIEDVPLDILEWLIGDEYFVVAA